VLGLDPNQSIPRGLTKPASSPTQAPAIQKMGAPFPLGLAMPMVYAARAATLSMDSISYFVWNGFVR
jgi:hypothetical protein